KDLYFKDSFKNLIRFSLAYNIIDTIKRTDEFSYNNNDYLLYLYSREKQLLEMKRAESLKLVASYQVIQYSFSDDFKQLLLHRTDGSFQLLDLKNQKKILVWTPDKPFQSWSKAVWANNKVFVLFSNEREIILQTIGFSDINTEQLFKLPPNEDSWQIDASLNGLRRINDSVWIVGLRQLIANLDKVKPQVWRGSDKRIVPNNKKHLKALHPGIITSGDSIVKILPYSDQNIQYYLASNNLKFYSVTESSNHSKIS